MSQRLNIISSLLVIFALSLPLCAFESVSVMDSSCTPVKRICNGFNDHGCTSTRFTLDKDATFWLTASVEACGSVPDCQETLAEVYLYRADNPGALVACVHSGSCVAESTIVRLAGGTTYTLFCGKLSCTLLECAVPDNACAAKGTVHP